MTRKLKSWNTQVQVFSWSSLYYYFIQKVFKSEMLRGNNLEPALAKDDLVDGPEDDLQKCL